LAYFFVERKKLNEPQNQLFSSQNVLLVLQGNVQNAVKKQSFKKDLFTVQSEMILSDFDFDFNGLLHNQIANPHISKRFRKSQNHPILILNPIFQNHKSNRFIPGKLWRKI
jgi:hypothetical protein